MLVCLGFEMGQLQPDFDTALRLSEVVAEVKILVYPGFEMGRLQPDFDTALRLPGVVAEVKTVPPGRSAPLYLREG